MSKMFLWWAIAFVIFPAVKVKAYRRNNTGLKHLQITVKHSPILSEKWPHLFSNRFLWTARHILVPRKNGYIYLRHSKLKIWLELELWANRSQEFVQWTNKKQGGLQNNLAANSNKYHFFHIFYLNRMENGKDNRTSDAHSRLVFKVQKPVEVLPICFNSVFFEGMLFCIFFLAG